MVEARLNQQFAHGLQVAVGHRLDLSVRTERCDRAAHINHRLVQGIPKSLTRVAANHHASRLRHKAREAADGATDDNIAPLERNAAAQTRIALDHEQAPMR